MTLPTRDLRPLGDRVDDVRRGLVGADFFAHVNLNLGVAAIGVERLQRDDVVALERRIQRVADFQRRLRQILRRDLFVSFDRDRRHHRLRPLGDREVDRHRARGRVRVDDRRGDGGGEESVQPVVRLERGAVGGDLLARDALRTAKNRGEQSLDAAARRRGDDALQRLVGDFLVAGERDRFEMELLAGIDVEGRRPDVALQRLLGIDRRVVEAALLQVRDDRGGGAVDRVLAVRLVAAERKNAAQRMRAKRRSLRLSPSARS